MKKTETDNNKQYCSRRLMAELAIYIKHQAGEMQAQDMPAPSAKHLADFYAGKLSESENEVIFAYLNRHPNAFERWTKYKPIKKLCPISLLKKVLHV